MADNTPTTPAATEPLVRIYNKRSHSIIWGKGKVAAPASFSTVPKSVADAWMKQWPGGVVTAVEAQEEVGGATAEANELRVKLAASEKRVAELEAKLGKPTNKRIIELEAQVAKLEEQLTAPKPGSDVV